MLLLQTFPCVSQTRGMSLNLRKMMNGAGACFTNPRGMSLNLRKMMTVQGRWDLEAAKPGLWLFDQLYWNQVKLQQHTMS